MHRSTRITTHSVNVFEDDVHELAMVVAMFVDFSFYCLKKKRIEVKALV